MKLIDYHCHLEEIDQNGRLETELRIAGESGIGGWISTALCRSEIEWHLNHKIEGMKWCAGIHPYYEKSSGDDLEYLTELCEDKQIYALGEIGLDKRNPDHNWQQKILLQQLDLASQFDLPVIFHVVKSYYELHKILKNNFPEIRGYLHGFNSSLEVFEVFGQFDLGFSLNARLPEEKVIRAIIKRGLWQIETDAPYARPPGSKNDSNTLENLIWVKEKIERTVGRKLWD